MNKEWFKFIPNYDKIPKRWVLGLRHLEVEGNHSKNQKAEVRKDCGRWQRRERKNVGGYLGRMMGFIHIMLQSHE